MKWFVKTKKKIKIKIKIKEEEGNGESQVLLTTTLINTSREIALPVFLLLEYPNDFRETEMMGKGGAGTIYKGDLFDAKLKSRYKLDKIAIKFIQGNLVEKKKERKKRKKRKEKKRKEERRKREYEIKF